MTITNVVSQFHGASMYISVFSKCTVILDKLPAQGGAPDPLPISQRDAVLSLVREFIQYYHTVCYRTLRGQDQRK